jgi:hypothetical protein
MLPAAGEIISAAVLPLVCSYQRYRLIFSLAGVFDFIFKEESIAAPERSYLRGLHSEILRDSRQERVSEPPSLFTERRWCGSHLGPRL